MKKVRLLILIISFIFVFISCNQQKTEWKGTIEEEDGVTVVNNPLEPIYEQDVFHLEVELSIDLELDDYSNLGIGKVEDFAVDTGGNIYLSYRNQIYKFDSEGHFILTLNQIGQGPGEYQRVSGLRITKSGELSFYDSVNLKFLLFNLEGILNTEIKKNSEIFTFMGVYLDNGYFLLREREENLPEKNQRRFHYSLLDRDFYKIKDLHPYYFIELPPKSNKFNLLGYTIDYEIIHDKIFISSSMNEELEIEVYNQLGKLLRKIRRAEKLRPSSEIKQKYLKRWKNAPAWDFYDLEKKHYFPDYLPSFKSIIVDEEERILVNSYELGNGPDEYIVYIFNSEGIFIGQKSLKEAELRKIKNNRLYCVYRKESGYDEIVVYKVTWNY